MLSSQRHPRLTLAATQAISEGSAFLRNIVLARIIGADEMGLAIALALGIRLFEMMGELGLDRLLVQVEESALQSVRRTVHLCQFIKGIVLTCLAALLAVPVTRALDPDLGAAIFILAAFSLLIRGASHYGYRERQRHNEFIPALVVEGGSNLLAVLAILPLALFTRDYTALAWASLLQAGSFCILSHLVAPQPFRVGAEPEVLKRCLRYGAPIALNGTLMFLALQGDRLIVALNFSAADLGRFALSAQLTLLPALIGARFLLTSELPRCARLAGDRQALSALWLGLLQRVTLVSALGVLALGLAGEQLVSLLYGETYVLAAGTFWLLAAGAGIRLVRAVPSIVLMAQERTHLLFMINLPRLLAVPLALWVAASGAGLSSIVAFGVAGEAASLLVALFAITQAPASFRTGNHPPLSEGA